MTTATADVHPGLDDVVVAETGVGDVLGGAGRYHCRGHDAADLARTRSLEEAWFLLHHGRLPDDAERAGLTQRAGRGRVLPAGIGGALAAVAGSGPDLTTDLRTALSLTGGVLGLGPWTGDPAGVAPAVERLVAVTPTLVAHLAALRAGRDVVDPDPDAPMAADYLRMLTGSAPEADVRAVEAYLVSTADHGLNASTFTARVVTSTGADPGAAVVAALGALSGPLHGSAPALVLDMLDEVDDPERAGPWVEAALDAGRRLMGFGHRVYRTEDPRAVLLREVATAQDGPRLTLAAEVERVALAALAERYPGRPLRTNVEFWAAVVLDGAGLVREQFTPTFAVSRMIGWTAHILEQVARNRLIRPASRYVPSP